MVDGMLAESGIMEKCMDVVRKFYPMVAYDMMETGSKDTRSLVPWRVYGMFGTISFFLQPKQKNHVPNWKINTFHHGQTNCRLKGNLWWFTGKNLWSTYRQALRISHQIRQGWGGIRIDEFGYTANRMINVNY